MCWLKQEKDSKVCLCQKPTPGWDVLESAGNICEQSKWRIGPLLRCR